MAVATSFDPCLPAEEDKRRPGPTRVTSPVEVDKAHIRPSLLPLLPSPRLRRARLNPRRSHRRGFGQTEMYPRSIPRPCPPGRPLHLPTVTSIQIQDSYPITPPNLRLPLPWHRPTPVVIRSKARLRKRVTIRWRGSRRSCVKVGSSR